MGVFPFLGTIETEVYDQITSKMSNEYASTLLAWIRLSNASNNGLIIESLPDGDSFAARYGTTGKSGRIGRNFDGKDVYADTTLDRSFRPSPTVESLSVSNGQEGLTRTATFTITCYTLAQAETIAKHFYQPGYVVLVEYGWNLQQSVTQKPTLTLDEGACEIAKFSDFQHIRTKRKNSKGTYDGFMGYITGGGFKSGDGETYVIDVELTTVGEIPTYLQIQKNGNASKEIQTDKTYSIDTIKSNSDDSNYGLSLFQRMYNKLPASKRTEKLKSLTNSSNVDKLGNPWTDRRNFINIDPEKITELIKKLEGGLFTNNKLYSKSKIPSGMDIISDNSFIRLELAFAILNDYAVNLNANTPTGKCKVPTYSYIVNTVDTVIGAHKWMFSLDGSKLLIPNSNMPDFGLDAVFTAKGELSDSNRPNEYSVHRGENQPNACPYKDDITDLKDYAFPSPKSYTSPVMPGVQQRNATPYNWGYLRNLYINLEFFVDVLNRSNYVAKDVYYEILNELSMAAGSYWQFEITETPYLPEPSKHKSSNVKTPQEQIQSEKDAMVTDNQFIRPNDSSYQSKLNASNHYQMSIQDLNFLGAAKINGTSIKSFTSKGIDTPFLSSTMDMPIPAIMRSQIVAKNNTSVKVRAKEEGVDDILGIFDSKLDPVIEILNSYRAETKKKKDVSNEAAEGGFTESDYRRANMEYFLGMGTIVSFTNITDTDIDPIVVSWNDISFLKQVEQEWRLNDSSSSAVDNKTQIPKTPSVSPMLNIDYSFVVHGVSGLKVGDLFVVNDIPNRFKNTVFQIMEQTHELSGGLWKTSVTAKSRNFGV